jgi:hypothetical protein
MPGRIWALHPRFKKGRAVSIGGGAPDSRIGLIIGDFASGRISGNEGQGAGKTDPPGGHIKVNRKKIVRETDPR